MPGKVRWAVSTSPWPYSTGSTSCTNKLLEGNPAYRCQFVTETIKLRQVRVQQFRSRPQGSTKREASSVLQARLGNKRVSQEFRALPPAGSVCRKSWICVRAERCSCRKLLNLLRGRLDQIGLPSDPSPVAVTDGQKRGNEWDSNKSEWWAQDCQRREGHSCRDRCAENRRQEIGTKYEISSIGPRTERAIRQPGAVEIIRREESICRRRDMRKAMPCAAWPERLS